MKSFSARLATLEALERAQQPEQPAYVCLHPQDAAALDDLATAPEVRAAIAQAYRLSAHQKLYVGLCICVPPEVCPVCADRPVIDEVQP